MAEGLKPSWRSQARRVPVTLLLIFAFVPALSQLAPGGKTAIGLNLDVNEQTLVNLAGFMTVSEAEQDANGWPASDFVLTLDNRYIFAWSPENPNSDPLRYSTSLAGEYRLTYTGRALVGGAENSVYDSATNTTSADYVIREQRAGSEGLLLKLPFLLTRRTPDSPTGTGVTNVRLERKGNKPVPNQAFTDLWLDSIRKYDWSAIRCMEMLNTNDYGLPKSDEAYPYRLKWATDRRLPATGPLYRKLHPGVHSVVTWEDIVSLAQLTRKDLWINVPVNASDEYVEQLATLLHGIPRDINLYVEYSNEMWHNLFPQGNWNAQAAQDEVKAGGTNLDYDGPASTPEQWRFRRMAKRTIEVGAQFRKVFSDRPERIRPVINNHVLAADVDMLQYVTANYGRPAGVLYAISQPAYYTSADSSSVDKILEGEKKASDNNRSGFIRSRTIATYFGLHSLCYEGGQEEKGGSDPAVADAGLPNKFAAARAPGMKDVVLHDLLDNWFPSGGELYMTFSQARHLGFWGMFGQTEDLSNLNTGKWLGQVAAMKAPLPPLTAAHALPTAAGQSLDLEAAGASRPEPWAMYLLRADSKGTYALQLRNSTTTPAVQVRYSIDNSPVASPVNIPLESGLHALFVFLDGPQTLTGHLSVTRVN